MANEEHQLGLEAPATLVGRDCFRLTTTSVLLGVPCEARFVRHNRQHEGYFFALILPQEALARRMTSVEEGRASDHRGQSLRLIPLWGLGRRLDVVR